MTDATTIESWSADPTVGFDRVHIIESLDAGFAGCSGRRLFELVEPLCASTPAEARYHRVATKTEFLTLMLSLASEAERGHFPILHIEAHGAKRQPGRASRSIGLVLASGEVVPWGEVAPLLIAINRATRLRFIVFVATCFGADITTLVRPLDCAPARVLIGPRESISMGILETGTSTFYRALFADRNGTSAVIAMNAATGDSFFPFTAEWLFLQMLKGYFNKHTSERAVAARAEAIIAPLALAGFPPAEIAARRHAARAFLADRESVFDAAYSKFFFADEFPEIKERFRMSYPTCFEEANQPETGVS